MTEAYRKEVEQVARKDVEWRLEALVRQTAVGMRGGLAFGDALRRGRLYMQQLDREYAGKESTP